jgi:C4-dicarboxylate transporter DctM subunit
VQALPHSSGVVGVGVHPIHFGIITVVNLEIGMVTPPLGICLFAGSAISGVSFEDIVRQIWPFTLIDVIVLGLITFIPVTTLLIGLLGLV